MSVFDEMEKDPRPYRAGDLFFTAGDSFIGRAIRRMTRDGNEPATLVNHVGLIVKGASTLADCWVVEAVGKGVVCRRVRDGYRPGRGRIAVWRIPAPSSPGSTWNEALASVVKGALRACGQKYSWGKIVLHLLDWMLSGFGLFKTPYLFRKFGKTSARPICSYLVARQFVLKAGLDFGIAIKAADPDDIWDWCMEKAQLVRPLMALRDDPFVRLSYDGSQFNLRTPLAWRARQDDDYTTEALG